VGEEQRHDGAYDHTDDIDGPQLLPPVVYDQNAHQGDGPVDGAVDENRPESHGLLTIHERTSS